MPIESSAWITAGIGVVVALVGYAIEFRGWTFLIAGYDGSRGLDDDLVGDVVGSMILRVGLAVLAFAGLIAFGTVTQVLELAFAAVILAEVARTVYRVNTMDPAAAA